MRRIQTQFRRATTFALILIGFASLGFAAQPSDTLLPRTTKGFLSVPDVEVLIDHWNRTELGQLVADPKMKPFVDDFRDQMQRKLTHTGQRLGLTMRDLQGVPGGEVAMAIIRPAQDKAASALLVDITGHRAQADRLLKKVDANLKAKGAKARSKTIGGTAVTIYDLPKGANRPRGGRAFYAIKSDMLLVTDDESVLAGMLGRFGGGKDSLQWVDAYIHVMARAREKAAAIIPQVVWFIEPFGLVETLRLTSPKRRRGTDMLKILARQGFTAIKGVGGFVNFSAGRYEFLHRTAIYAPPIAGGAKGEKYELAARLLDFPNSKLADPPAWVPREIATYLNFNLKTKKAFTAAGLLINEVAHDPTFIDDLLDNLKNDPNGPQVDIENDIITLLDGLQVDGQAVAGQVIAGQVIVVTDYQLPITPKSERMVVAVKTSDSVQLAKTINRVLKGDPNATRRICNGHVIWEIESDDDDLPPPPAVQIPNIGGAAIPPIGPGAGTAAPKQAAKIPNSAITVAHGYIMRATHIDFLKKVLVAANGAKSLGYAVDYQMVVAEMKNLGAGKNSFRHFSRTDEEIRPTYELIKSGQMPISETLFGRMLNRIFDNGQEDIPRKQQIDGAKLPKYDLVRRHLGPGGTFVTTHSDGWLSIGFMLRKQQPRLAVGLLPDREEKDEK